MEYVPFQLRGSGSDCLWIYCQSGDGAGVGSPLAVLWVRLPHGLLKDTQPSSVGLPELNPKRCRRERRYFAEFKQFVRKNVLQPGDLGTGY